MRLVFLTHDGRIKILDVDLAQEVHAPDPSGSSPTLARHTEPGAVLGTVGYMSPEQVRGQQVDARSDVFSFGAVLYEMVSGRRAFGGDSTVETMHAILRDDPPSLAETNRSLPAALERIIHHCLEKRPEQRFHSAHDVAFDLQAISSSLDVATRRRTRLHTVGATDPAGAGPPTVRLSADGKSYAYSFFRSLMDRYLVEGLT